MEELSKPRVGAARNLARKLLDDANIHQAPIILNDVISWLKKSYDIEVIGWDFGEKTSGIQITEGSTITIGYNKGHDVHRQRFTVAHEIGHLLFAHTNPLNYDYNLDSKDTNEIEANQFAAELLMPLSMLKNDIKSGNSPKDMAKIYNVSEESVWWRLNDQNLINKL